MKQVQLILDKYRKAVLPTTYKRKLSLCVWCQSLILVKLYLKVNRGIIILSSSFICLSLNEYIKASIMFWYCKSSILSPQKPKQVWREFRCQNMYYGYIKQNIACKKSEKSCMKYDPKLITIWYTLQINIHTNPVKSKALFS